MDVKVCNLRSNDFEENLIYSVRNTGFAIITHHGIDHSFIKETQMAWKIFFLNNNSYKELYINSVDPNMGYKGFKSEKALGAEKADLKEFFHWKPGQKIPYEVSTLTQHMFYQLEDVSMKILGVLDRHYDIPNPGFQNSCLDSDNTLLRALYYPALNFDNESGAVRAAAHEDINFITLLVAASAPGLQVKDKNGRWHDVPHEDNSITVNIGDMLQLASGGMYKSTTHRVINPDNYNSDRVSIPLFVHPHSNTLLADGITAKKFLEQRLDKIYQKV